MPWDGSEADRSPGLGRTRSVSQIWLGERCFSINRESHWFFWGRPCVETRPHRTSIVFVPSCLQHTVILMVPFKISLSRRR